MGDNHDSDTVKLLRGIAAGAIAGAVASFAMDRFQAAVTALSASDDEAEQSEPATEQAADAIAARITGRAIADPDKPLAGQTIHYALGIGLGIAYGIVAEFRPAVTAGYGSSFGLATATLLDEGIVPAAGLGAAAWNTDLSTNLFSYASHLVFGGASEFVRRQVAATMRG